MHDIGQRVGKDIPAPLQRAVVRRHRLVDAEHLMRNDVEQDGDDYQNRTAAGLGGRILLLMPKQFSANLLMPMIMTIAKMAK